MKDKKSSGLRIFMLKKLFNLIKEFIAIRKHLDNQWHFWLNEHCLFCLQHKATVERQEDKWRCDAIRWTRSLVNDRISVHFKGRIIEVLGDYSKYFVGIKAWLQIPLFEHGKRFVKRHLR